MSNIYSTLDTAGLQTAEQTSCDVLDPSLIPSRSSCGFRPSYESVCFSSQRRRSVMGGKVDVLEVFSSSFSVQIRSAALRADVRLYVGSFQIHVVLINVKSSRPSEGYTGFVERHFGLVR